MKIDWATYYKAESQRLRLMGDIKLINKRIRHFKCTAPLNKVQLDELQYLILHYDYNQSLFRRYRHLLSVEFKIKWLEFRLIKASKWSSPFPVLHGVLLPFFLINPEVHHGKIDKLLLSHQLLLTLGCTNHPHRRFRMNAIRTLKLMLPTFSELPRTTQRRVAETLISVVNPSNKHIIKKLFLTKLNPMDQSLLNKLIDQLILKGLMTPWMALGFLRRRNRLSNNSIEKLEVQACKMEQGAYALSQIYDETGK